jgi:amino acid transporter
MVLKPELTIDELIILAAKHPVFAREATGLVRDISPFNTYVTTISASSLVLGAATAFVSLAAAVPGANMPLMFLILIPFLVIHSALYAIMMRGMPRSGGDYVWVGRIFHPGLAMSLFLTEVIYVCMFNGTLIPYEVQGAVYSSFVSYAVITHNPGVIAWAAWALNPLYVAIIGTVFLAYVFYIMVIGVRSYLKHQIVYWTIGVISTIAAIAVLWGVTPTQFAAVFDAGLGSYTTYQHILDVANGAGFSWAPSWSFGVVAGGLAMGWLANNCYQWGSYFAGEVKNIRLTSWIGSVGNNLTLCLVWALFSYVLINAVGANWFNAIAYLTYVNTSLYTLPITVSPYFLASIMTNNVFLSVLINIGMVATGIICVSAILTGLVRILLAMSFDRVLPTKISEVSEKYHTPVLATLICVVITWIGMFAGLYYGIVFAILNAVVMYLVVYAVGALVMAFFPWLRPSLYQSTGLSKYKLGPIPIVTVLGLISFVFLGSMLVVSAQNPLIGGLTAPQPVEVMAAIFILCGVLYFVSRAYHLKKDGFDLKLAFTEVPPE